MIAVVNQKGGVGKTTTALNLGHALARQGRRVGLIDLDPQGHLAACLGIYQAAPGADQVLGGVLPVVEGMIEVREWCRLLHCGPALSAFEQGGTGMDRAYVLRDALAGGVAEVDTVLIDCPPSSGILIVNAMAAADDILVPAAGDYLSLTGLARLMLTVRRMRPLMKDSVRKWIFMSRFVARRRLSREVYTKIAGHFPHSLLTASISEAAALAECAGAGRSIFEYRANSKSAREFDALAEALINQRVVAYEQQQASHVA